jgi:glycosyltransferase involved in cell wall biosynthesis
MLLLCPYPEGVAAGQRLKYEPYIEDWRAHGWDVDVAPFMDMGLWRVAWEPGHLPEKALGTLRGYGRRLAQLVRHRGHDLAYVFMWATPLGPPLVERIVRARVPRLVYDLEDNVLVGQGLPRAADPNAFARLVKGSAKPAFLVCAADHVIASSPLLAGHVQRLRGDDRVTYITASVDTDRFRPRERGPSDGPVTIGWTGTFSSRVYLDMLSEMFVELARRVRFRLRVIGNFDHSLPGVDLEVVRWSAEREVEDMQAIDIGVYPLPDDPWVAGKSGLKAIQYMAFGIPVVASHAGFTPEVVADGETGILVRTETEWLAALERLIRDPGLRQRLGTAGRRRALERYSRQAVRGQYRAVLEKVMTETPC